MEAFLLTGTTSSLIRRFLDFLARLISVFFGSGKESGESGKFAIDKLKNRDNPSLSANIQDSTSLTAILNIKFGCILKLIQSFINANGHS